MLNKLSFLVKKDSARRLLILQLTVFLSVKGRVIPSSEEWESCQSKEDQEMVLQRFVTVLLECGYDLERGRGSSRSKVFPF